MAKQDNGSNARICGNCFYCHEIVPGEDGVMQGTCYGAPPQVNITMRPLKVARAGGAPFEQVIQATSPPVKFTRPACWLFKARKGSPASPK